ncbi:MAG TPA: biotin/lipoyl-containing protein [Gemmataceae bacterium]|jgi:pyruvate/2-oxoglutarate dehydrogenase complex dihydrolipoamide acyltransferase (E2) component|nr:biotin/lipoyl-containing protein [Gemmataceae bacterium]HEV3444959.1 biotin/lipoyl-containing protein [Gemmataceae bacterium]
MQAEIIMPEVGADSTTLSVWFADVGEAVFEGDRLVEVVVGGATFDVPAPATGRLAEKRILPDDPLRPGQVLGLIELEMTELEKGGRA